MLDCKFTMLQYMLKNWKKVNVDIGQTTYLPLLTFVDIWTTTYLPRLVNVVCERPLCVVLVYLHESIFFKAKNCQCEIRIQKIFYSIVIESQRNKMFIETLLFWWMTCMRLDVELAIGLRYVVHCYHNLISNLIRETQWFIFVKFVYNHE